MTDMTFSRLRFFVFSLLPLLFASGGSPAADFASHSARYQMHLIESRMPGLNQFEGELVTRLQRNCDSWTLFAKFDMSLGGVNSLPINSLSISLIEESLDGRLLRFRTQNSVNGEVLEEFAGEASGGEVRFSAPESKKVSLKPSVLFPMHAAAQTLDGVVQGKKFFSRPIFQGDGLEPMMVTDIVNLNKVEKIAKPQGDAQLLKGTPFRLVSSFFKLSEPDSEPVMVNVSDMYPNGVTSWLSIDTGIIKAAGTLTQIEAIEPKACNGGS